MYCYAYYGYFSITEITAARVRTTKQQKRCISIFCAHLHTLTVRINAEISHSNKLKIIYYNSLLIYKISKPSPGDTQNTYNKFLNQLEHMRTKQSPIQLRVCLNCKASIIFFNSFLLINSLSVVSINQYLKYQSRFILNFFCIRFSFLYSIFLFNSIGELLCKCYKNWS